MSEALIQQSVTDELGCMGSNGSEDKRDNNSECTGQQSMVHPPEQQKFNKCSNTREFTVDLSVPHPLGKKEQASTETGDCQIECRGPTDIVEQKGSKDDRRTKLMYGPDKD
jgi:hypothetical protein